jgi:sulfoxide reductase heme-binding subunit YedZ
MSPRVVKVITWLGCLTPLALLILEGVQTGWGVNPVERITHFTGFFGLIFLCTTLAITPIRRITGWNGVIKLRRLIGLFSFFYLSLHLLTYIVLDRFFDFSGIGTDIAKRPYMTVGFTAFLLLIPLAVTSTKGWIRRLGRRWELLHRLIYVSAVLGILHFIWKEKLDTSEPFIFAIILGALFLLRLPGLRLRRRAPARRQPVRPASRTAPS